MEMCCILIVGVVRKVYNTWQNSSNSTLQVCLYKLHLNKKKEHWGGEKEWASGSEPLAGRSVSFEFSNFYSYCIFTLPSIYGGDTDFPFVVVV